MTDRKLLSPEKAIPLLRAQLQEAVETLRHDDPDVDGWERVTQTIVERTFGERSKNANHFACRLSSARQSDEEFMRKFGADGNAAQLVSQVVEPSQVFGRLTEKSRKAMIAALKPFAVSGRLIDIVKYANDSEVADLAYQLSAVLRDAGWKPTEYMRSSYEPLSGLLIEIDPKNPPTRAAADALLSALSAAGLSARGPVLSLSHDIGLTEPPGAGAAIRLTIGAMVSR
jgi:hypothetical protein